MSDYEEDAHCESDSLRDLLCEIEEGSQNEMRNCSILAMKGGESVVSRSLISYKTAVESEDIQKAHRYDSLSNGRYFSSGLLASMTRR